VSRAAERPDERKPPRFSLILEMGLTTGEAQPKLSVQASSGEYDTKLVLLEPRAEPKA